MRALASAAWRPRTFLICHSWIPSLRIDFMNIGGVASSGRQCPASSVPSPADRIPRPILRA
eukprot:6811005-Pyramimonas_sp.AAC.1